MNKIYLILLLLSKSLLFSECFDLSTSGASLAGSQTASPDGAGAILYNPAAVVFFKNNVFTLDYRFRRDIGTNVDRGWYAGLSNPFSNSQILKGFCYYRRAEKGGARTSVAISFANLVSPSTSIGANIKYIRGPWKDEMRNNASLDIGFDFHFLNFLSYGLTGQNLADPEMEGFERSLNTGLAITPMKGVLVSADIRDIKWDREDKSKITLRKAYGLSFNITNGIIMKTGYAWKKTYCGGMEFSVSAQGSLQYSFMHDENNYSNHNFGISILF